MSGKRIGGESGGSSLHFSIPENAVGRPTSSLLLEQLAPSVTLEVERTARRLILNTGSNVSLLQPGISRIDVRDSPKALRIDPGSPGHKRPAPSFLHVGGRKLDHFFWYVPFPLKRRDF